MIVVELGVKTECKIYGSHTGVKLGAKQFNIFKIDCKTTIYVFLDSIVNLIKINKKSHHCTFHLKHDSDSDKIDSSHGSGKNVITWAWPTSTTII
jgi:hypothetical protein